MFWGVSHVILEIRHESSCTKMKTIKSIHNLLGMGLITPPNKFNQFGFILEAMYERVRMICIYLSICG